MEKQKTNINMKEFKLFILSCFAVICVALFGSVFTSCSNDDDLLLAGDTQTELVSSLAQDSVKAVTRTGTPSYSWVPSINSYTTSLYGVDLGSIHGTNYGGNIRAKLIHVSGSSYKIKIEPKNTSTFQKNGMAYVKLGSPSGDSLGDCVVVAGSSSATVNFTLPSLTYGIIQLYPLFITSQGYRSYADPFVYSSSPLFDDTYYNYTNGQSTYSDGYDLGKVNNVHVYSSGTNFLSSTSDNQCTNFCRNYYQSVYKCYSIQLISAKYWFSHANGWGFIAYNNGDVAPRIGDILCFGDTGGGNGHVAIITKVSSSYVEVTHQNGGCDEPIGWQITRSGNNLSKYALSSTKPIQGWMRLQ